MNPTYNDPRYKDRRRFLRKEQTEVERKLWFHLRNRKIHGCKFYRQYGIGSYILDFYCPEARLAVELDGGQHNEESIKEYDKLRTRFLEAGDIRVLRFWNNEVLMNLEGVLERIAEEVGRGVTPPNIHSATALISRQSLGQKLELRVCRCSFSRPFVPTFGRDSPSYSKRRF